MAFFKQYHWVFGLLILAVITTLMVGTPSMFVGRSTAFIYSNLSDPTANQTYVRTKMDFGSNEVIQQFPFTVGDWTGSDYEVNSWKDQLGADVAIMRGYRKPGTQEIWFLAMQSKSRSSFHPPEVCYPAMGWELSEEGYVAIPGEDASWIKPALYPKFSKAEAQVQLKKLLVTKDNQRRLVLYFYVKHAELGSTSDIVTMIRISAVAPRIGSYENLLTTQKELLMEFIPYMFDPGEKEDIIIVKLAKMGFGGVLLAICSFAVPLGILFYPQILKLRSLRLRA